MRRSWRGWSSRRGFPACSRLRILPTARGVRAAMTTVGERAVRVLVMGTGAAEGVPSVFCACATCAAARKRRGKDIRRRCSVLINDDLLVDLGPDLFTFAAEHGMYLGQVRYALQTHPHDDHLDGLVLFARCDGTLPEGIGELTWFCHPKAVERADLLLFSGTPRFPTPEAQAAHHLTIEPIAPWRAIAFGSYRVQTMRANHAPGLEAMLFAIEDTASGGRLFYGNDTGPIPEDTWQRLADLGWRFDVMMLDHTHGFGPRGSVHLNSEQMLEEVARARAYGVAGEHTRIIATHFAHHSNPPHEEFVARAAVLGYEPAWDGMAFEVAPPSAVMPPSVARPAR